MPGGDKNEPDLESDNTEEKTTKILLPIKKLRGRTDHYHDGDIQI